MINRIEGGGYSPSPEVVNYANAYEWQPELAAHKLAPVIEQSWFAQELKSKLSFRCLEESEALSDLANKVNATPEYKQNLRLLLDYMEIAGLIQREGSQIKAVKPTHQNINAAPPQEKAAPANIPDPPREPHPPRPVVSTSFTQPTQGVVQFHVSVKVDMSEFAGWSPERIAAFFGGIAQVLAAKGAIEKGVSED